MKLHFRPTNVQLTPATIQIQHGYILIFDIRNASEKVVILCIFNAVWCGMIGLILAFHTIFHRPPREILQGGTRLLWGLGDRLETSIKIEDLS